MRTVYPVRLWNLTPFEREEIVITTIRLDPGQIMARDLDGNWQNTQNELVVYNARGAGSRDWVQYWPNQLDSSDYEWTHADGSLRRIRVAFPARLAAGVAPEEETTPGGDVILTYDHFSEVDCEIRYEADPANRLPVETFDYTVDFTDARLTGIAQLSGELSYDGESCVLGLESAPDHEFNIQPMREVFAPYGPNSQAAWIRTHVTNSRIVVADWTTRPSFWGELWWQATHPSVAGSHAVDVWADCGPHRITEDDAPDQYIRANVTEMTSPVVWSLTNFSEPFTVVMPHETAFTPEWDGANPGDAQASVNRVNARQSRFRAFDPTDSTRFDRGSLTAESIRLMRSCINEGASLPNRLRIRFDNAQGDALAQSTFQAQAIGDIEAKYVEEKEHSDCNPWGFTVDQSEFHDDDDYAHRMAANYADNLYRDIVGQNSVDNPTGAVGTGRYRRDPYMRPDLGMHANTPSGGLVVDFQFIHNWWNHAPNREVPDMRAQKISALAYSSFPVDWRYRNGRRWSPLDYVDNVQFPNLGTWRTPCVNGHVYDTLHSSARARAYGDWLGRDITFGLSGTALSERITAARGLPGNISYRGTEPGGGNTRKITPISTTTGRVIRFQTAFAVFESWVEDKHQTINNYAQTLNVTGHMFLTWKFEDWKNYTLTSLNRRNGKNTSGTVGDSSEGFRYQEHLGLAADKLDNQYERADARYLQFHHYCHMLGGCHEQDVIVRDKLVYSMRPHMYGLQYVSDRTEGQIPATMSIPAGFHATGAQAGVDAMHPIWQGFMITLKDQHLRAIANVYEATAQRWGMRKLEGELEQAVTDARFIADRIGEWAPEQVVSQNTGGAPVVGENPNSDGYIQVFACTTHGFQAGAARFAPGSQNRTNAGNPAGAGEPIPLSLMHVPNGRDVPYFPPGGRGTYRPNPPDPNDPPRALNPAEVPILVWTSTRQFVFQIYATLWDALELELGTVRSREHARRVLEFNNVRWQSAFRGGNGRIGRYSNAQMGWGEIYSASAVGWFTRGNIFGPFPDPNVDRTQINPETSRFTFTTLPTTVRSVPSNNTIIEPQRSEFTFTTLPTRVAIEERTTIRPETSRFSFTTLPTTANLPTQLMPERSVMVFTTLPTIVRIVDDNPPNTQLKGIQRSTFTFTTTPIEFPTRITPEVSSFTFVTAQTSVRIGENPNTLLEPAPSSFRFTTAPTTVRPVIPPDPLLLTPEASSFTFTTDPTEIFTDPSTPAVPSRPGAEPTVAGARWRTTAQRIVQRSSAGAE